MKLKQLVLAIFLFASVFSSAYSQDAYKLNFQIDGLKDSTAYLAYYYGKGQYYRDTSNFNSKGAVTFSGKDTLRHGMYSLIIGKSKILDLMVDNQEISMKSDTASLIKKMQIKGSPETSRFYEYLDFLAGKRNAATALIKKQNEATESEKAEMEKQLLVIDQEVKDYMKDFHKRYDGTFTSNFVKALQTPSVPEAPKNADGSIDSTFAFRYFKAHYWDGFDFSDGRLIRTSTYDEKMNYYMDKLTVPDPDSIIKSVDYMLNKAKANKELFKYTLSQLTSKYERSEAMGMDAVFVHLSKNYFMKGMASDWFTEKQLEKLAERANALDPLLIGKKAPNIVVKDTAQEKFLELYKVDADFTIVYIWSPECGHCKTATPKLKTLYDKVKDKGVEVFAVGNEFENEGWKKFIIDHDLNFINGSDGETFQSNFRTMYDVYSTPQTYLLDENKEIIAKKMSIESLEKILEYFMNEKAKEANEK